jgi:hypothetical protein
MRLSYKGKTAADLLLERIEKGEGCWLWTGAIGTKGYGRVQYRGQLWTASRAVYNEFVGPIPAGMWVLHRCDNPPCVNPAHLFLGTHTDNVRDAVAKGRHFPICKTHCKRGHPLEGENLILNGTHRRCRTCKTMMDARRSA